ncbi:WD40 repeat domain-containing protein [Kribbella sp. NPDC051620]|uniref:WD40 repeat domain-containing protein n=1 Tax=Kribbella sp. NPDC051620 TaxID=3364120 RepID=UPI00379D2324
MPSSAITPLHERLRRRALGLEQRNEVRYQERALTELEKLVAPKWRPFRPWSPSPGHIAWYARTLAEVYTAGSGDPVRGVFTHRRVSAFAWYYLERLTDPSARQAVWQVWLRDPDGGLKQLIKDWLPADARQKAVTLFLLGDQDAYAHTDPSGELVENARREGDPLLRVHLATAARRGEHVAWAYRVAAVPEHLLPEEWEAVIALLRTDRQQYLWQALAKAPLEWSARCLVELADWQPADQTLVQLAKSYANARDNRRPFEALGTGAEPPETSESPKRPQGKRRPLITAISPDGSLAAKAQRSGAVRLRRTRASGKTTAFVPTRPAGIREVDSLLFTPDGDILVTGGRDCHRRSHIAVARVPGGEPIAYLTLDNPQTPPLVTPDGTYLAAVEPTGLALWRLPHCHPVDTAPEPQPPEFIAYDSAITPDSRLLVRTGQQQVDLYDLPSGRRLPPIPLRNATTDGVLLTGTDADGATAVLRYRTPKLADLAARPLAELTGKDAEAFYNQYDEPSDAALAKLAAALLTHLRRDRPRGL